MVDVELSSTCGGMELAEMSSTISLASPEVVVVMETVDGSTDSDSGAALLEVTSAGCEEVST